MQTLKKVVNKHTILKAASEKQIRGPKLAKTLSKNQERKLAQSVNEAEKIKSLLAASSNSAAKSLFVKNKENRPG